MTRYPLILESRVLHAGRIRYDGACKNTIRLNARWMCDYLYEYVKKWFVFQIGNIFTLQWWFCRDSMVQHWSISVNLDYSPLFLLVPYCWSSFVCLDFIPKRLLFIKDSRLAVIVPKRLPPLVFFGSCGASSERKCLSACWERHHCSILE